MYKFQLTLILSLLSLQSLAQVSGNFIKNSIKDTSDPKMFVSQNKNDDFWFAYTVPTQPNTPANCCWNQGKSSDYKFESCDLTKQINGFGNRDNGEYTQHNHIFINVKNQKVNQIIPVGQNCQIKAEGIQISWLENTSEAQSLNFLKKIATDNGTNTNHNALYAMAMHQDSQASQELYNIGLLERKELSKNAIFWLGEARDDGFKYLKSLYEKLSNEEIKGHLSFALSLLKNNEGLELLEHIAINGTSKKQKSEALFWMAEIAPDTTKSIIFERFDNPNGALDIDHMVFTLSRLPENQGDESLFELLKGDYSKAIKTKALFWLGQSENEQTFERLQKLL